ncbi:hypothetical protein HDU76_004709 [Blyttiomyces sp. JEL0837]|nr:hypothetical protein HDU76_004709 [Blyttiomyces sp. JEL0837]
MMSSPSAPLNIMFHQVNIAAANVVRGSGAFTSRSVAFSRQSKSACRHRKFHSSLIATNNEQLAASITKRMKVASLHSSRSFSTSPCLHSSTPPPKPSSRDRDPDPPPVPLPHDPSHDIIYGNPKEKIILNADTIRLFSERIKAGDLGEKPVSLNPHVKWKYKSNPPALAAVMVMLCHVEGEASILFTVRASKLRKHAGQVSFPGGRMDPSDATVLDAALRETHEEIGIPHQSMKILGGLSHLPDRTSTIRVHPFLGVYFPQFDNTTSSSVNDDISSSSSNKSIVPADVDVSKLIFNHDEVSSVFTLPLSVLLDPSKRHMAQFRHLPGVFVPNWAGPNGEVIWGLTAFILDHLFKCVIAPPEK